MMSRSPHRRPLCGALPCGAMLVLLATAATSTADGPAPHSVPALSTSAPRTSPAETPSASVSVRSLPLRLDHLAPSAFADWVVNEATRSD